MRSLSASVQFAPRPEGTNALSGTKRYSAGLNALVYDLRIRYHGVRNRLRGEIHNYRSDLTLVHIPKCAGVSLRTGLDLPNKGHKLLSDFEGKELHAAEKIVFSTRDPFDRVVSTFQYLRRIGHARPLLYAALGLPRVKTFEDFIHSDEFASLEAYHYFFRSQFQYLKGIELYRDKAVHLRFATLEKDFEREFGGELPRMNAGKSNSSGDFDTPENRERVRQVYRADYELLPKLLA